MNRRESLKALVITTTSTGVLIEACKPKGDETQAKASVDTKKEGEEADRQPNEIARDKKLHDDTFFTPHEMATITVLGDIIIPKDEHSGSASEAKVPEFIEFTAKDRPNIQTPIRGGLRWLDLKCLNKYNNAFKDCTSAQQLEIVDQIAYLDNNDPELQQGISFFDKFRGLVAGGFFSSKMGVNDLGYVGNRPNKWTGVPDEVIKHYGLEDVKFT